MNRTLTRMVGDVCKGRRRIRVVVLGSASCGKTVLMTSLACHLRNHDREAFKLNDWEASWAEDLLPKLSADDLPNFPDSEYRREFEKPIPEFPKKTLQMSMLRLPLELRKGSQEKAVLLELLDLPGERVTDLVMAHKNYREWCEWMHKAFVAERCSKSFCDYLEKAKRARSAEDLFVAYKEHLWSEYKQFSPWITPSIVKLTNGSAKGFLEGLANRPLGIDVDSQFVPLPIEAFDSKSPMRRFVKDFEDGYRVYRKKIVDPIADWVSEADQLVYLVDVLNILKKGLTAYNAEFAFGSAVIGLFKRQKTRNLLGPVVDWFTDLFKTELKGGYLVATKADIAYKIEGRNNMCNLAEQILGKAIRGLGLDLPPDGGYIHACAAVNTVNVGSGVAKARQSSKTKDETDYSQPVVPERWPDGANWEEESMNCWFEDTYPRFDMRQNAAPLQIGLDDLVRDILKNVLD